MSALLHFLDNFVDFGVIKKLSITFSLLIPREFSADVLLDANSWWVTGGTGYGGTLATTEIMRLGAFSRGPDLPWPMAQHCVTKVDETRYRSDGHIGQFLVRSGNCWSTCGNCWSHDVVTAGHMWQLLLTCGNCC